MIIWQYEVNRMHRITKHLVITLSSATGILGPLNTFHNVCWEPKLQMYKKAMHLFRYLYRYFRIWVIFKNLMNIYNAVVVVVIPVTVKFFAIFKRRPGQKYNTSMKSLYSLGAFIHFIQQLTFTWPKLWICYTNMINSATRLWYMVGIFANKFICVLVVLVCIMVILEVSL